MPQNRNPDPYSIKYRDGYYRFTTEAGAVYECAFSPIPFEPPIELNDFQFYPDKPAAPDPRVPVTVSYILQDYFDRPEKALMYICDPADGKWQARQRLFKQWHENMGKDFVDRHDLTIRAGKSEAKGGLMVRKDFPYQDYPGMVDKVRGIVIGKF